MPPTAPTATTAPTESFPALHPPYRVGFETVTFVDHSRVTPANGTAPGTPYRTLQTSILYPATGTPTAKPVANLPASHNGGPFPLIVFAHGLDSNAIIYFPLIAEWAEAGFVVVAPTFPLSNLFAPGGDTAKDLVNQPGDMSFVLTQALRLSAQKGNLLSGMIDPRRIAAVGHSLGAMTVLAWAENTCCEDHRVDAAVIIDGTESTFGNGKFFEGRTVPILVLHGTADQTIPYANGEKIYDDATHAEVHDQPDRRPARLFPATGRHTAADSQVAERRRRQRDRLLRRRARSRQRRSERSADPCQHPGDCEPSIGSLSPAALALRLRLPFGRQADSMKLSRTLRTGLSTFGSTRTRLCQVPRAGEPPITGSMIDGEMKTGSRWSAP